jgi:N-acetylneuraminate synthase
MTSPAFSIGQHEVGRDRCFIIGEVAQAHDGSLGMAHAYIDAVARAGADAVKFQTHIAEAESSPQEPWRVKFSPQDATRYDYWRRMEFSRDQWRGLKIHAEDVGMTFLSSPFSMEAVDLLEDLGTVAWKVASGEINNPALLNRMALTGKPVLLSSGMSSLAELDRAVAMVRAHACPVAVMQCTSNYPTPPEKLGLNLLAEYRERYVCPVGLSDHSGNIFAGLAAATLGADLLEVHVTMSREMFGPDVGASVTTDELAQLIRGIRFIESSLAHPVDKNMLAEELSGLRNIFTKSLFLAEDLPAGTVLKIHHLAAKKPGSGIPAEQIAEVLGRRLVADRMSGWMLRSCDLVCNRPECSSSHGARNTTTSVPRNPSAE